MGSRAGVEGPTDAGRRLRQRTNVSWPAATSSSGPGETTWPPIPNPQAGTAGRSGWIAIEVSAMSISCTDPGRSWWARGGLSDPRNGAITCSGRSGFGGPMMPLAVVDTVDIGSDVGDSWSCPAMAPHPLILQLHRTETHPTATLRAPYLDAISTGPQLGTLAAGPAVLNVRSVVHYVLCLRSRSALTPRLSRP